MGLVTLHCTAINIIIIPGVLDTLGDLQLNKCPSQLGGNINTQSQQAQDIKEDLKEKEEVSSTASTTQRTESSEPLITEKNKTTTEVITVASTSTSNTATTTVNSQTSEGITDISDILKLNTINFNSLHRAAETSTSPTMKIDIAIIEETSTVLPMELGEIGDLEINNNNDVDTVITKEEELDIPESSSLTLDNIDEDVTDIPVVAMETTVMADDSELNITRESRFLENPSPSEYHPEQDGQINFSKVYRSEASTVSSIISTLILSALIFIL